jgi:hypothetical protein
MVERDRSHMTISRMHIACCTLKATNTHSGYEIIIAFPLKQWFQKMGCSVRSHAHYLSCFQPSKADSHSKHRLLLSKAFKQCSQWKTILLTVRYEISLYRALTSCNVSRWPFRSSRGKSLSFQNGGQGSIPAHST